MASGTDSLDKSGVEIERMFSAVAPRYDLLNRLLSARRDQVWRQRSAAALTLAPGSPVLDVCCGTGDQALALRRRDFRVSAADFSLSMLHLAQRKYGSLQYAPPAGFAADALQLPVPSGYFAGVTVSFGLRNVVDLRAALRELRRILRVGGEAAILEFALPTSRVLRICYLFYFRRLLPLIGSCLSPRGSAYSYLPNSVIGFPQRQEFVDHLHAAGFRHAVWHDLSGGIVCLYTGKRES
jgi:demethylmenaquinone methyltransferase/2-methoxy-6-polyprenyl-1,4-benzoquinol methylase